MEVDEGVVALVELVDVIGQLAPAPVLDVVNRATLDSDLDTLHDGGSGGLVGCGIDKIQQFISLHVVHLLWASGSGT